MQRLEPLERRVVAASLPGNRFFDAVLNDAVDQQINEQRDAEYRNCQIPNWKRGTCNPRVEPPKCPNPKEQDNPTLPRQQPVETEGECWKTKEENEVQSSPQSKRDRLRKQQSQVLCPALNHLGGRAVHVGGERVRGVAKTND